MKKFFSLLALVGVLLAVSPGAYAAHAVAAACKADVQNYCSSVQKGGGRIAKCLKSHASELSEGCKSAIQQKHAAAASMKHSKNSGIQPAAQAPAPSSEPAPSASEPGNASSMPSESPAPTNE